MSPTSTSTDNDGSIKMRASRVLQKATNDDGIDLNKYTLDTTVHQKFQNEKELPPELKATMTTVGIDVEGEKSGIYFQAGNSADLCVSKLKGVELLPLKEAMKIYDGTNGKINLMDYFWKAVPPDKDKYTAEAALQEITQGYFIYARKGQKTVFPLQSCLFVNLPGIKQVVHNIIIAEEDAQLDIITGCTVHKTAQRALHLGVSEFYCAKNSRVSFTMVHNWSETTNVRPRTGIILQDNAQFSNFYVVMSAVQNLQTNPVVNSIGKNTSYLGQTLIYGKANSLFDTGTVVNLIGEGSKAEIISRVLAVDSAHVITRGKIVGEGAFSKGHINCSALLLSPQAQVDSIPEIQARNPNVSLTHEASIGKIAEDHIEYLMSRGLKEEEAINLIVSGFLDVDTSFLPPNLAAETKKIISMVSKAEMG